MTAEDKSDRPNWEKSVERRYDANIERFMEIERRLDHIERVVSKGEKLIDEWFGEGPNDRDSMRAKTLKLMEYTISIKNWGAFIIWVALVSAAFATLWGFIRSWVK